jgi:hypothetical protein
MKSIFAVIAALLVINQPSRANTIDVSYGPPVNFDVNYSVSGSSGDWLINFSVTNNTSANTGIYFFDVLLPSTDIVGSPPNWAYAPFDNPWVMADVRFGSKADIATDGLNVSFTPESGH